ncbi:MAG TPA: TonB-dependent receptor [Acidobacteriaceae bacterium]|nr:TonB-dependent receptor [Acidobacteriaceae bacterium]
MFKQKVRYLVLLAETICLVAAVLLVHGRCAAQMASAELAGTVLDSTGAAVPGATVTVTNTATSIARSTTSEKNGEYVITALAPGDYNVTVESPGFRKLEQTGLVLQINQQARVDLTLQVGQAAETVSVSGHEPLLESESSSVGTVVNQQLVNQLPLNGRNFVQLAVLSPGVNGVGESTSGTIMGGTRPDDRRPGSEIFSNGNREGDNNFLYDGVDNNERLTLSITLRPAVEAVREFKIQTNLYSADVGRNSGAVVDVITKSGTNQLHGSLFEFIRNSDADARTYFNKVGSAFPSFRFNQFGGSLGGPVVIPHLYHGKDKTFFFVDYEGFRSGSQIFELGNIPTLRERQGDFGELLPSTLIYDPLTTVPNPAKPGQFLRTPFPNNIIPQDRFDPIAYKMINAYPTPTSSGRFTNYSMARIQTQDWDQGDVRIDEQITQKDSVFARWSIQNTTTISPSTYPQTSVLGLSIPVSLSDEASFAGTSFQPTQHVATSYVRVFSPTLVNDFRVGFNRYRLDYVPINFAPGIGLGNQLGVPNSNVTPREQNLPIFSPATYLGVGQTRSLPLYRRENTFQELDNLTWTKGTHTFKIGADFRRRQLTIYQTNEGNGRFNFSAAFTDSRNPAGVGGDSAASFILGFPTLDAHDYNYQFPGIRLNEFGSYFADDWRATKNLTINYGIRWDYFSPPDEAFNRWSNFDIQTGTYNIAGIDGVNVNAGVLKFWPNIGPRFGFAYQAMPHTVIRGGVGLFYNASGSEAGNMRLARNLPFGETLQTSPGDVNVGPKVSQGFPPLSPIVIPPPSTGVAYSVSPSFRPSYAEQFNTTVEQEIPSLQMVLKFAGVGNLARHLEDTWNANQPIPGSTATQTRRPLYSIAPNQSDVDYYLSDGFGNYLAFQFTADKRLSHGVTALLGYTFSHAIDDVPLEFGGGDAGPNPQDPRFPHEVSNSIIDQRQRLTLSYLWEFPFGKGRAFLNNGGVVDWILGGWQNNGLLFTQSGLWFSPVLQTSTTNTGTSSRPNLIPGAKVVYPKTISNWFLPSAFATPAPYTYGDASRNSLLGPGRTNFDTSIFKTFPIREGSFVEFRIEAFNVFNHPQFGYPNATVGTAQVGQITSIVGNARNMQAAIRIQF